MSTGYRSKLNDKELRILEALWMYRTDKLIAASLGIPVSQVKSALHRCRNMMGADNRVDLMRFAIERGLIGYYYGS